MGSIVCKAEREVEDDPLTGYIAMLAVDTSFRKHGIGKGCTAVTIALMYAALGVYRVLRLFLL